MRSIAPALVLLLSACSGDDPLLPEDEEGVLTLHADPTWVYVRFDGDDATQVNIADPAASTGWDIAFFSSSVMLNGGSAGPGTITGHCLCQNENASGATVMAMTAATQRPLFDGVTATQIPTEESAWASEVLDPVIEGWYSYNPITHIVSASPDKVWYFRTASADRYAKLHFVQLDGPTQTHAGAVSIEFALAPAAGGNYGTPQTVVLDLATGAQYLDLETASVVPASDPNWDLSIDGYTVRLNGGVSGSGGAGALAASESFAAITAPSSEIAGRYAGDSFGGVFSEHPWYRYNLTGTDHQIWPTFDVYLLRKGESVYKVQLIGYYNSAGDDRWVSFRYERLR